MPRFTDSSTGNRFVALEPTSLSESVFTPSWGKLEGLKIRPEREFSRNSSQIHLTVADRNLAIETVSYRVAGSEKPVATIFLVPGAGHPASLFEPLALQLVARGINSVTYSAPGTGNSPLPKHFDALGLASLIEIAEGVFKESFQQEPNKVFLLGHSLGGLVSRVLSNTEGVAEKLAGVVLLNSMTDKGAWPLWRRLLVQETFTLAKASLGKLDHFYQDREQSANLLFGVEGTSANAPEVKPFLDRVGTLPYGVFLSLLNPLRATTENGLAVNHPTLVVAGQSDRVVPASEQDEQIRKMGKHNHGRVEHKFLSGEHDLMLQASLPEFSQAVLEFVTNVRKRG